MLTLKGLRKKIERIDAAIIKKLAQREAVSKQIRQLKLQEGLEIIDSPQEKKLKEQHEEKCAQYHVPIEMVEKLFKIIIAHSRIIQKE